MPRGYFEQTSYHSEIQCIPTPEQKESTGSFQIHPSPGFSHVYSLPSGPRASLVTEEVLPMVEDPFILSWRKDSNLI